MAATFILTILVAIGFSSKVNTQKSQDALWEGGWMALNETPQQSNEANNPTEFRFSSSSRNSHNVTEDINEIVTQIINSRRQGRNLEQYNQVYADGNIDEALQLGNEIEARNIIRDKLCMLGLMSCESTIKRPIHYIRMPSQSSRPQPSRYINNNFGARPPPSLQTLNSFGPTKKFEYTHSHYNPNTHKPYEPNKIYGGIDHRPFLQSTSNRPQYAMTNFQNLHGAKPPIRPASLQQNNFHAQQSTSASSNILVGHISAAAIPNPNSALQQHVHHHFHHVDNPNESLAQQQHVASHSLANVGGIQASGSLAIDAPNNFQTGLSGGYTNTHNSAGSAQVSGSFHTQYPENHKKELHNIGGIHIGTNNGFNTQQNGGHIIERQQILNCFCVPFNQCPAGDRIGRKEDLILPIDPRNLGKDIAAYADIATFNGTKIKTNDRHNKREAKPEKTANSDTQSEESSLTIDAEGRAYYGNRRQENSCRINETCCRRPLRPAIQQNLGRCGTRNAAGITGRIKNPIYVDGDSEFGEYPWHVAILKKDPKESIYACGATLIDALHVITAAHCIKAQNGFDLRARLGEWDVNHDVEFFPYVEREIVAVHIHPEYYAGTLDNDLALLKFDKPVDFQHSPHISPACLPDKYADFTGARCWTTGWGKNAFGDYGKYQNILKEVDVPILSHQQCEAQLRQTRLGYNYKLNPGFLCAGGEEGKDACKGDGGGPLVCERNGIWNAVGVVSWGIGCGQANIPGVYVRVAHYLDWIQQLTQHYR